MHSTRASNDAPVKSITNAGADVHRGDLEDLESLKSGAKDTDGVIHLVFAHDANNYARSAVIDRAAIETLGEAMVSTGKPLIVASGTLTLPKGKLGNEDTRPDYGSLFTQRRGFRLFIHFREIIIYGAQ